MKKKILPIVLLFLLFIILTAGCSILKRPLLNQMEVMGFYEQGWSEETYGYPSLEKHYQEISVLMPFWYTVKKDGSLDISSMGFEQKVVDFIIKHPEVKLFPLISLGSSDMLLDEEARSNAVDNIVQKVKENDFAGVNIDFELLPPEVRDGLTDFVKSLADNLKPQKVSVSVFPAFANSEEAKAYDYEALGKYADFIADMTYDKYSDSTGPGPIAPYDWVEDNIKYALKTIPKDKLVVTIGAYGYDWPVSASEGEIKYLGLNEILKLADEQGADVKWDNDSQSPYFTYQADDTEHEVWFENGYSISRKVALAKKYGLRGVAIWRMGLENEEYWELLEEALRK